MSQSGDSDILIIEDISPTNTAQHTQSPVESQRAPQPPFSLPQKRSAASNRISETQTMSKQFSILSQKLDDFIQENKSALDFFKKFIDTDFGQIRAVMREMREIQDSAKSTIKGLNSTRLFE